MDTSVTLIGLIIIALIAIPSLYIMRSQQVNKGKIKQILEANSQNGRFHFGTTETQNKKIMALDETNNGFVFIDLNVTPEMVFAIDLNEISSIKLVETTTHNSPQAIVKLELAFKNKNTSKPDAVATFFDADVVLPGQFYAFEEQQFAKKWQQKITESLS